ncbi:MAG: hypothetical protein ACRDD2_08330 [Sarcina sp.]
MKKIALIIIIPIILLMVLLGYKQSFFDSSTKFKELINNQNRGIKQPEETLENIGNNTANNEKGAKKDLDGTKGDNTENPLIAKSQIENNFQNKELKSEGKDINNQQKVQNNSNLNIVNNNVLDIDKSNKIINNLINGMNSGSNQKEIKKKEISKLEKITVLIVGKYKLDNQYGLNIGYNPNEYNPKYGLMSNYGLEYGTINKANSEERENNSINKKYIISSNEKVFTSKMKNKNMKKEVYSKVKENINKSLSSISKNETNKLEKSNKNNKSNNLNNQFNKIKSINNSKSILNNNLTKSKEKIKVLGTISKVNSKGYNNI